jgi:hypothetical protein
VRTAEWLNAGKKYEGLSTWTNFATELEKVTAGQASSSFDLNPRDPVAQAQAAADALYLRQQITTQQTTYNNEGILFSRRPSTSELTPSKLPISSGFAGPMHPHGLSPVGSAALFRWVRKHLAAGGAQKRICPLPAGGKVSLGRRNQLNRLPLVRRMEA